MKSSALLGLEVYLSFDLTYRCWNKVVGMRVIALVDRADYDIFAIHFRSHSSRDAITSPIYGIELCT